MFPTLLVSWVQNAKLNVFFYSNLATNFKRLNTFETRYHQKELKINQMKMNLKMSSAIWGQLVSTSMNMQTVFLKYVKNLVCVITLIKSPSVYMINENQTEILIDLLHQSHDAPIPYPTMHHFVTEMCTWKEYWIRNLKLFWNFIQELIDWTPSNIFVTYLPLYCHEER